MAEPSTAWGREAISDIRVLQSAVAKLDQRIESFEAKVDARFETLDRKMEARFEANESKIDTRIGTLERRFDALAGDFREFRGEVRLFMSVVAGAVVVFGVAFLATGAWLARSVIELQVRAEQADATDRGPIVRPSPD